MRSVCICFCCFFSHSLLSLLSTLSPILFSIGGSAEDGAASGGAGELSGQQTRRARPRRTAGMPICVSLCLSFVSPSLCVSLSLSLSPISNRGARGSQSELWGAPVSSPQPFSILPLSLSHSLTSFSPHQRWTPQSHIRTSGAFQERAFALMCALKRRYPAVPRGVRYLLIAALYRIDG